MNDLLDATTVLETVAHVRCPCGHLRVDHAEPSGEIEGEVMGECQQCSCMGVIDAT